MVACGSGAQDTERAMWTCLGEGRNDAGRWTGGGTVGEARAGGKGWT